MAETMAIELVKVISLKLADKAFKIYARSQGIHSEIKNLGRELSRIQAVLNDASNKEIKDEAVQQWLNDLQHLAYDIDDVLDDVATEAMHRDLTPESGATTSKVRKFIPTCCTNFALSHRLVPKLDSLTTELERLDKQIMNLGFIKKDSITTELERVDKQKNDPSKEKPESTSRRSETSLLEPIIVGRESKKEELINKLLQDEPSNKNFVIVPIVGLGGIGKTTLARMLYNDARVKKHFELDAWVCVSDEFHIFNISETIFQSVARENKSFKDLNQLQVALMEQLKGKRFLLVLDDVWSEKYNDWEILVRPFHSAAHGSRIIMTTRKQQLFNRIGFKHIDHLASLSPEDALSLFALHALGEHNFDSHTTLKPKGEGIVKKCGGLPLALKVIGTLLRTKTDDKDWDDVLNSEIWDLENADEIVPALMLSYHGLSADLKRLFAYCSLFPKDFLFNKEQLILMWMAEGFLNPSDATKSPERLGHEYFETLLSRSFFQHAPNEESFFTMHDLVNDLATFVARKFYIRHENHKSTGNENHKNTENEDLSKHRHMSFLREEYVGYHKFEVFTKAKKLRTLLAVYVGVEKDYESFYLSSKILVDLLPELPLLRVLSLSRFEITEVPESIGSLKHLRYLNLSRTKIKELPENVCNLYNLQTLIVFGCSSLAKLPKSFLKLKKLRHFDVRNTPLLKNLPIGIGELKSLQTLTKIIIEGENGFTIKELKGLKSLHGKISIEGLHNVQTAMHARDVKLSLKEITNLELKWVDVFDVSRRGALEKEVLNELEANGGRLKELSILSYGGEKFSNWVGDPSFHELVSVSISGCRKCTCLPPFGQLPSLKKLFIKGMDGIRVIGMELYGSARVAFPSLKVLMFEKMLGWKGWSTKNEGLNAVFPHLQELYIISCPKLIDVSLEKLPLLKSIEIFECDCRVLKILVQAASSITMLEIKYISGLTDEVWRDVIGYLGSVEELRIWYCNEIRYLWNSEAEASMVLVSLKKLSVRGCSNVVSLGENGEEDDNVGSNLLSSLMQLHVFSCESMERCCCPNSIGIESLLIFQCSSLTHVCFPTIATQKGGQKMKSLTINYCNKLMGKIDNTSMPMLEYVYISNWGNLKSIDHLSSFIHLTYLYISSCPIKSFADLRLSNLKELLISDCESLESFPELSSLTLLEKLEIKNCPSIDASFPYGVWPPKLRSLRIGRLKKPISEWGDQNFPTSLVDLSLWDDESDVSNYRQLSHLLPSSLIGLGIEEFDKLESLSTGLEHLTSLQHLGFYKCPNLIDLPETLLPSLLSFGFNGCPKLKERCNGRGSHYWSLISHIPYIEDT